MKRIEEGREKLTEDQIWKCRMKLCSFRTIIVSYSPPTFIGPRHWKYSKAYPTAANHKGMFCVINNFYAFDRKVFVIVQATGQTIKIDFEHFYFCDSTGAKLAEPGEWPPDILSMNFDD